MRLVDALFYFFLALYSGTSMFEWLLKVPKRGIKQRDAIALILLLTSFILSMMGVGLFMFGVPTPNA